MTEGQARKTVTSSSPTIPAVVAGALRNFVSTCTISRRLVEGGLVSRSLLRVLPLRNTHRRHPLQWCRKHQAWTAWDWQRIVFIDEFHFCLGTHDGHVRIRLRVCDRLNTVYIVNDTQPQSPV